MCKLRPGNKQNALINGEWGRHVRRFWKRQTSGRRRTRKRTLLKRIQEDPEF
jgi:hypothetical protein